MSHFCYISHIFAELLCAKCVRYLKWYELSFYFISSYCSHANAVMLVNNNMPSAESQWQGMKKFYQFYVRWVDNLTATPDEKVSCNKLYKARGAFTLTIDIATQREYSTCEFYSYKHEGVFTLTENRIYAGSCVSLHVFWCFC